MIHDDGKSTMPDSVAADGGASNGKVRVVAAAAAAAATAIE